MLYKTLGTTDIKVSQFALGCWPFAGGKVWGVQEDSVSIETVHAALDKGINFFDTAEGYDELEYCHWEVTVHYKKSKEVLLRATLNPEATIKIDWRELRDRARWSPGWRA